MATGNEDDDAERGSFHHRFLESAINGSPQTLLLLHGTGGDEDDLLELGRALAPSAALLSPRGRVLENGAPRFFSRLAEGVFDQEDLARRTDELAGFVAEACVAYRRSPRHVTAVGFSNGANIAASMLLRRPAVLASAVLFRPMVPFEPAGPVSLLGKPVLVLSGRSDPVVPTAAAERLVRILGTAGAMVSHQWLSTGHALSEADVTLAHRWLAAMEVRK